MPPRGPSPLVTGVSPKEGPPGTRITIRGENLGNDPRELIGLKICGVDCLLSAEWKSPSKIIARTGPGKGKGDVIVTTKTGGQGTCTVGFRGYFIQIGPLQESAVWIDESQTVLTNLTHGRPSSPHTTTENEDPLGISHEEEKAKFTEEDLLEMFPEASGNLSLANFSPVWYLLENHHGASFDDLKAGLQFMKRKASQRSAEPITIARANLTTVLDCLESLKAMHKQFSEDDLRGETMNRYAVLLMQAKSCADGLFQDVLGRKDRADSTRNALSVLQKFRFLFYLPLNMERNIQKGDYNMVINDFEKAKSLFADTEVGIFKRVYNEVEKRIRDFRETLHTRLLDPSNSLEEQRKLIRYLISLEYPGDAAWECLLSQQAWLISLLNDCMVDNIEAEKQADFQAEQEAARKWKAFPDSNQGSGHRAGVSRNSSFSSTGSQGQAAVGQWKVRTPQRVFFMEELTRIMMDHFPDFWKLGQAYFTGDFLLKETTEKSKIDTSKHSKLKQMLAEIVGLFGNLVRAAFLPDSLENVPEVERKKYGTWATSQQELPGGWLPYCVRHIRLCASTLSSLDIHGSSMKVLKELAFDMRTNCMFTLLKQAIADVKGLHVKETWVVETDDEHGGTTQLPALFENIVNETIQHLHEVVVLNKPGEPEIFSERPIQKEATVLCTQLLQAFAQCMEQLAFNPPLLKSHAATQPHPFKMMVGHDFGLDSFEDPLPSLDKRLIIMLSNCNITIHHVVPRIIENLNKHGYVEMNKASKAAEETYHSLDAKLFEAYIEQKSDPIVGTMEPNMYRGGFQWDTWKDSTGVRHYLKEVIMSMIEVHAEVFAISPAFVPRVLRRVMETVCEEMSRLILCNPKFSPQGGVQARLELSALQDVVSHFISDKVRGSLNEAFDYLPGLSGEDKKNHEEMLNKFRSQMKFHLMCFHVGPEVKRS